MPVPEVAVRRAAPADEPELERLAALAVAELRAERGGAVWEHQEGAWLTTSGAPSDAVVFVGTLDDVVVGAAVLELQPGGAASQLAVLRGIYVEPAARELGVGEALIGDVLTHARGARCAGIDSFVLPGTRQAKNFFEAHGLVARGIVVHRRLTEEP